MFIFMLAFLVLPVTANYDECPSTIPANYYLQIFGDFCYQFVFFERRDYQGALDYCTGHGGTLALVKSNTTSYFLENEISHRYFRHADVWIGLSNLGGRATLTWEDGSLPVYTNWAPGQQVGDVLGQDRCASLNPSDGGRWHLNACTASAADMLEGFGKTFVCQYNVVRFDLTSTIASILVSDSTTRMIDVTPEKPETVSSLTIACPPFSCNLDCGVDGFKKNSTTQCSVCECDV